MDCKLDKVRGKDSKVSKRSWLDGISRDNKLGNQGRAERLQDVAAVAVVVVVQQQHRPLRHLRRRLRCER